MTQKAAFDYLDSLSFRGLKLGLENTKKLLKRLGDPHKNFGVIHIAGTNGKGSTATMISSCLTQAGIKNGLYISPHLESFRERIGINGKMIGEQEAVNLIEQVKTAMEKPPALPATYFEFMTAMALLYFAQENARVAVIEVGLGGRFDSTNVVDPLACVITSVAMDHCDHLGANLADIAFEKCGVIKKGVPVMIGVLDPAIAGVANAMADEISAPLFALGKDFDNHRITMSANGELFDFHTQTESMTKIELSLIGKQQIDNASLAIETLIFLREQGFDIDQAVIRKGLKTLFCPGRFEVIKSSPMVILDGAHNTRATELLNATLQERFGKGKVDFIFGPMRDKDYKKMMASLNPTAKSFICFAPNAVRAADPDELVKANTDKSIPTRSVKRLDDIIRLINTASPDSIICVTGSFYTVGEIRSALSRHRV